MDINETAAVDCFAALGHPTRIGVYRALVRAGQEGAPMGALQDALGIPASTLSHHVQALVRAGLVYQVRDGRTLTAHADYEAMDGLVGYLTDECCHGLAERKRAS